MAISGRQVLEQLRHALEESRGESSSLVENDKRLKTQVEQLFLERGGAFLELAQHDLPNLRRETIQTAIDGIRRELQEIADRQDRAVAELKDRIGRLQGAEQELVQSRTSLDAELNRVLGVQKQLETTVQSELQRHPDFPQLSQKAVEAEAELHRNEKRVAEVQSESQEKLPAYERSSLFQYLYRRRFLTEEYTARGLTRRLDRWVANLIGYVTAVRGYEFLKKTPELMRAELERRRELFHSLMSQVEAIEQQVADRVGLTSVLTQVTTARQQRDKLDGQIAESRQQAANAKRQLAEFDQDQNRFYREALERYRKYLSQTESAILEQHAKQSPGIEDDAIVSRIRSLTSNIENLQGELQSLTSQVAAATTISDGLDFVVRRMQQSNFDEPHSRFESLNLNLLLDRFRQGVISKDAFWSELKQKQEFDHPQVSMTQGTITPLDVINVVTHPMTRVLASAMIDVLGQALQSGVNHSIERRSGQEMPWSNPSTTPQSTSRPSDRGSSSEYTTVDRI